MSVSIQSSPHPTRDQYDVVVVGGGMAGLTTGALLACNGMQVLVIDANDAPGGVCRTLEASGYAIDLGVHLVSGCNRDGPFGPGTVFSILERLGVSDQCELIPVDPFYTARLPGQSLVVPAGREAYVDAYSKAFPAEREGFKSLVDLQADILREWLTFPITPSLTDWLSMPFTYPKLFRHRRTTMAETISRYIRDPKARALFTAIWPYPGLPPAQASFVVWAIGMSSYVEEGAFYCRGGFQRLADAVAMGLVKNGGEILLERRVERILVRHKAVEGVILDGGEQVRADTVVAAGDARETFGKLIPSGDLPRRWNQRIRGGKASLSILSLYLGTDRDIGSLAVSKENIVQHSWDLDANWDDSLSRGVTGMSVWVPTVGDPSIAPTDRHQVAILIAVPPEFPDVDHSRITEQMVSGAEQVIPNLGRHITFAYGANKSSLNPSELPLHRIDAAYGWAASPQQSGPLRLPATTPIRGLCLAGHWTQPGHGIRGVMVSGLRAARLILSRDTNLGIQPLGL
jgi:phytoene dehydrogenase-like protein